MLILLVFGAALHPQCAPALRRVAPQRAAAAVLLAPKEGRARRSFNRKQRIRRLAQRVLVASSEASTSPWEPSASMHAALSGVDGNRDLSPSTYASLLLHFKQDRKWRASCATLAHALEHEPHKLNARHFSMGIGACGTARKSKAALRLLEAMEEHDITADLVCFNSALSACAATGDHASALRLLHESIPGAGLRPDAYSYSACFTALGRHGRGAVDTKRLLEAMEAAGVPPTVVVASTAMTSLLRGGLWQDALDLFEKATRGAISGGRDGGVSGGGDGSDAADDDAVGGPQWLVPPPLAAAVAAGETRHAPLQPDVVMYGAAMSAANAGKQWGRTLSLLDALRSDGLRPSQHIYAEALCACREAGLWSAAAQLHGEMLLALPARPVHGAVGGAGDGGGPEEPGARVNAADAARAAKLSYNAALDAVRPGPTGAPSYGGEASELFAQARRSGAYDHLERRVDASPFTLDLHGLSVGAAQQAVLWWLTEVQTPLISKLEQLGEQQPLEVHHSAERPPQPQQPQPQQQQQQQQSPPPRADDLPDELVIITGRGRHRQPWQRSAREAAEAAAADGAHGAHGAAGVRGGVEALLKQMNAPLVASNTNNGTLVLDPKADWSAVGRWLTALADTDRRANEFKPAAPPRPSAAAATPKHPAHGREETDEAPSPDSWEAELERWEQVGGSGADIRLGPAPGRRGDVAGEGDLVVGPLSPSLVRGEAFTPLGDADAEADGDI